MKTAMQELFDTVKNDYGVEFLKKTAAKSFLKKEKEQIVKAHIAGQKFSHDNNELDSEEYYNQTFKNV
jgi:hypothetical protein